MVSHERGKTASASARELTRGPEAPSPRHRPDFTSEGGRRGDGAPGRRGRLCGKARGRSVQKTSPSRTRLDEARPKTRPDEARPISALRKSSDSQAACIRSALFTICSSEISLTLAPKLSHTRSSRRFACAAEKPNVLKARARSRNLVDGLTSESTVTFGSTAVDPASRMRTCTSGTVFNFFNMDQKSAEFAPAETSSCALSRVNRCYSSSSPPPPCVVPKLDENRRRGPDAFERIDQPQGFEARGTEPCQMSFTIAKKRLGKEY